MSRVLVSMLVLLSMLAPVASADDALKNALSVIPSNAMAVVSVPNVKTMDADFQAAIARLELQQMLPFQSLVTFVQEQAPFLAGLEPNAALTLVIMPAMSLPELQTKQVILVPSKDPQAMIEGMGGQAGEGGMWTVMMFGQPAQAIIHKNHVVIAQAPEVLNAIKSAEETLANKIDSPELASMADMDLVLWLDADQLFALVKPMVQMMMQSMVAMQASRGAFAQKSAEMNKDQVDMFMDGAAAMSLGIGLGESGVTFRGAIKAKPGTELAKQTIVKVTADSLLEGLPGGAYVAAFGGITSREQLEAGMKSLNMFVSMLSDVEGVNQEKAGMLKDHLEKMFMSMTGSHAVIESLEPGPGGLIGATFIANTSDSAAYLDHSKKVFDLAKEMVNDAGDKIDDEVKKFIDSITLEREAEEVAGVKVDVLMIDLAKLEDLDEEDIADIKKIIGDEGVKVRMAPANNTTVAIVFGGGTARFEQALKQAQSAAAPLAQDAGIQKMAALIPPQRNQVGYLAVDNAMNLVQNLIKAADEEPLPFETPKVDAPLTFASTGGDNWVRIDVIVPMDLIVAGKNVGMSMMGGQPPAAGMPAGGPPPTMEDDVNE